MKDNGLLAKIGDNDFVLKEVRYHHSCRKSYLNSAGRTQSNNPSKLLKLHDTAFSELCNYIDTSVVQDCCAKC